MGYTSHLKRALLQYFVRIFKVIFWRGKEKKLGRGAAVPQATVAACLQTYSERVWHSSCLWRRRRRRRNFILHNK